MQNPDLIETITFLRALKLKFELPEKDGRCDSIPSFLNYVTYDNPAVIKAAWFEDFRYLNFVAENLMGGYYNAQRFDSNDLPKVIEFLNIALTRLENEPCEPHEPGKVSTHINGLYRFIAYCYVSSDEETRSEMTGRFKNLDPKHQTRIRDQTVRAIYGRFDHKAPRVF